MRTARRRAVTWRAGDRSGPRDGGTARVPKAVSIIAITNARIAPA